MYLKSIHRQLAVKSPWTNYINPNNYSPSKLNHKTCPRRMSLILATTEVSESNAGRSPNKMMNEFSSHINTVAKKIRLVKTVQNLQVEVM